MLKIIENIDQKIINRNGEFLDSSCGTKSCQVIQTTKTNIPGCFSLTRLKTVMRTNHYTSCVRSISYKVALWYVSRQKFVFQHTKECFSCTTIAYWHGQKPCYRLMANVIPVSYHDSKILFINLVIATIA